MNKLGKTCAALAVVSLCLVSCKERAMNASASDAAAPVAKPAVVKDHNYQAVDGVEYSYVAGISDEARKAGQAAASVINFRYAGERDGKHQVHTTDGATVTAMECARPCEVIKLMSFMDADYLRNTVKVERIVNQPGSLANAVFSDVLAGKLHQYGMGRGGKKYQVWIEEKRGLREFVLPKDFKQKTFE